MKKPDSIWKDINLIGRARLVKKLQTLINQRKRFALKGVRGVGRTALLEFCHELARGKTAETGSRSALVDMDWNFGTIVRKIAADWDLDVEPSKGKGDPTQADLETAILQQEEQFVFADNLDKATGQKIRLLKILAERNVVSVTVLAGVKLSEEQRQFLWFVRNEVPVPKLPTAFCEQLARKVCVYLGSRASIAEVAAQAHGLPGRVVAFAVVGEAGKDNATLSSEEIDLSPALLVLAAGLIALRYIGRSVGATDFVLLGGAGMVVALLMRLILQQGKAKK